MQQIVIEHHYHSGYQMELAGAGFVALLYTTTAVQVYFLRHLANIRIGYRGLRAV